MDSENMNSRESGFNWNKIVNAIIIPLVIIAIIGLITSILNYGQRITKLEAKFVKTEELSKISERLAKLETTIQHLEKSSPKSTPEIQIEDPKGRLIEIIKAQQSIYVKESWGTEAYQCFTDDDFSTFKDSNIPSKINEELKNDNEFISLVFVIKKMPPNDRQKLLTLAKSTYKRTWDEMGRISREGQTDTGQKAEKLIAKGIVDLISELQKLPKNELEKLYK